jgi:acyl carrier protein
VDNRVDNREAVRKFLQELLAGKGDTLGFADSDSLILSGRLESIDVLDIVVFLEKTYRVDFGEQDFDQTTLDTVNNILAVAERQETVGR